MEEQVPYSLLTLTRCTTVLSGGPATGATASGRDDQCLDRVEVG